MTPPLPLEEAQARLLDGVEPLGVEILPAERAVGRWLVEPIVARRSSPEADLSSMDGFATAAVGPWRLIGESAAGRPFAARLAEGEAVRISTGAWMPQGSDAVVLREDAQLDGDRVSATGEGPSAAHIRQAGFDFRAGETVLDPGMPLGPVQLALALAAGATALSVGRLARLAIIDTGDELATSPADLGPGRIPATNGAMLAGLCDPLARDVVRIGPVPDDRGQLLAAFESARDADLVVTSGGASVGDHDLVRPALEEWGAEIDFWRVALRPGKPMLIARRGAQTIVGLPGNPVSAFVTGLLFVLPLLRRLAGAPRTACMPRAVPAVLAEPVLPGGARREFLRARWTAEGVIPIAERDSSALRALAQADALIDRPAGAPSAATGEAVPVISLGIGGIT